MFSSYLLRLDDALPTQNTKKWEEVEQLMDKYEIKPMVAIIPNNKDEDMKFCLEDQKFWVKVKRWKSKGWAIGLHGYNHSYHKIKREHSIVKLQDKSEFVGLSLETQKNKFSKALKIFEEKGIKPDLFIAPSHSFDYNTVQAMKQETSLNIISDGIALSPFYRDKIWFIPQQLWKFKLRPFGLWTVCIHPNTITNKEMQELASALSIYNHLFTSLNELYLHEKWYNKAFGSLYRTLFWSSRNIREFLNLFINKFQFKRK